MKFWVILATIGAALAQTPAPPVKNIVGEVTAADQGAKQLTMKADNGPTYTLKLDAKTSFLRIPPGEKDIKKATPITINEVGVGDRVLARGAVSDAEKTVAVRTVVVMSKTDLAKLHEQERQAWQNGVVGTVTAISPATKEISVKTRGADAKTIVVDASGSPSFLRYAPGSYQFSEAKPGTLEDIQPGDTLRVRGQKSEDGARVKADQILSGSFLTFAGKVDSVDPASGVISITDFQTKQPMQVRVASGTLVRRIPPEMAVMMARRLNPSAAGAGAANGAAPDGGAPNGAAQNGQRPGGAGARPAGGFRQGDSPRSFGNGGGPGARRPGGFNRAAGGNADIQQMLEQLPPVQLSDLKPGDALIVSSSKSSDPSKVTAITVVAGVEPFLASAPRSADKQVNLGDWSLDGGLPAQE